ncbi:MAG: DUF971 domain-containing protein [Planctomycetota bacterium]|nr:MAG: DUF971 domain-containing protein [Planctomycetota bacterium]REJ87472.1 MAG: DUF971 domain-containing protein [Planctomycetota bacterium]REK24440.1 MAG: DUF971 domain-containing protein [Planctomycetota bacterium]REK38629.1 MAG: DUF971 domain-containing protein [Planctomycetota bacterium]
MNHNPPTIVSLKGDQTKLQIAWSDGARHEMSWRLLREACPCATCREEKTQPEETPGTLPVISAAEAQPLRGLGMKQVGNYAYGIQFSDGHTTGIYSIDYLRRLGEAAQTAEEIPDAK